jgi:hypothetical protein
MPQIDRAVLRNGLLVDVRIGVSAKRREQLWKQGLPIPGAVLATFIVDTGADTTMVNDQHLRSLGLGSIDAVDQTEVLTSESRGVPELCDVFDIEIEVPNYGHPPWVIRPLRAIARPLMSDVYGGMLSRDVIDRAVLHYDGPRKRFTIDYHADLPLDDPLGH